MRIAICVKQVPAASDVQIDRQTKRLRRDKAPAVMNECDRYAWSSPSVSARRTVPP